MTRVYNFSAGPACLPEDVLKEAASEMLDYAGHGMSVMEMSHRSQAFATIIEEAEQDLRDLLAIPDNYKVLFLQGGAWTQFAAVPLNIMQNGVADYIDTGSWSSKAAREASQYGDIKIIASSEATNYDRIPDLEQIEIRDNADYVYICENNTIYGTRYHALPDTGDKPLVADVSSCILSEPMDISRYGILFAGAQKNVGPAGVTLVIIRDDLIRADLDDKVPTMLRYKTQADKNSLFNTPPTYGIYICGKVFKWLKAQGGLEAMRERNHAKAKRLYAYLDQSNLFRGTVETSSRSNMNVCFVTGDEELDQAFVAFAEERGLVNLKGHRSVGGMRASLYNAMPEEGVDALIKTMKEFEVANS